MERERFAELSVEFLLTGLEGAELAEFQAELERRGEAGQAELARLRETLAAVAFAAPPAAPPAGLRERVLAATHETSGEPEAPGDRRPPAVVPLRPRATGWRVAAVAAAVLAALLAVWNVRLRDRLQDTGERLAASENELAEARQRLAAADSAAAALEPYRRDVEALASPQGSSRTLVGTETRPAARARVFVDPMSGRAILYVFDLPVLPPGAIYELWAIKDGVPVAAGTFSTGNDGRARVELAEPQVLEGAEALAVTEEPAPGGPTPTGRMVLRSS